jgi:uncharacterized protein (DUF1330 family)
MTTEKQIAHNRELGIERIGKHLSEATKIKISDIKKKQHKEHPEILIKRNKQLGKARKGKNYEILFGSEKAKKIKEKKSESMKKVHAKHPVWAHAKKNFSVAERKRRSDSMKKRLVKFGKDNPAWKGGRYLSKGYWHVRVQGHPQCSKNGYVREHRLVMEKHLGRYLQPEEHVHHIDFDKTNNAIENLLLIFNKEHMNLHNNIEQLMGELIRKGVIKFDKEKRKYYS